MFGPWAGTELYANAGMGFHSNDARGAVITRRSVTGEPAERVTPLVRAKGAEFGVRTVRVRGLQSTVSLWYLGLDSELLFVGDAGTTEAGPAEPPLRRRVDQLLAAASVADRRCRPVVLAGALHRRRSGGPAAFPGALDRVISAASPSSRSGPSFGSLRVRHFGPRPLIEDASVQSKAHDPVERRGRLPAVAHGTRLVLEVFNLFDAKVSDIDYFYTSRLPASRPAASTTFTPIPPCRARCEPACDSRSERGYRRTL